MAKVTGIGGVFFKSSGDRATLAAWYQKHLGMTLEDGVEIQKGPESHENGKFAWIMDPDNNKVELWEPSFWVDKTQDARL